MFFVTDFVHSIMSAPGSTPRVIPEALFAAASAPYIRFVREMKANAESHSTIDGWEVVRLYNAMMAETKALCEADGFTADNVIHEAHRRGTELKKALQEMDRREDDPSDNEKSS